MALVMKIDDLILDNGKLSTSKVWFNLGNVALTFAFIHGVLYPDASITGLMFAYGGLVHASRISNKVVQGKYNAVPPSVSQ